MTLSAVIYLQKPVLCSHNISVLHRCDRILWLEHGRVRALGEYSDLLRDYPDFASLVSEPDVENHQQKLPQAPSGNLERPRAYASQDTGQVDTLIQDEDQETRSVSWRVYGSLFASSNSILFALLCI